MHEYYISELINEWGVSKTIQIVMFSFSGACLIGAVCILVLPNKPTEFNLKNDKENRYEKEYFDEYN